MGATKRIVWKNSFRRWVGAQAERGLIYNIDRIMYFYVCIQKTPQEKLALLKMLQASMEEHEKKAEEMAGTLLGDAKNDVRELTEGFMNSLDEKMGEYLSDIETKKDDYHWSEEQCDGLRGEIISLFNYKSICKNELGIVEDEDEEEDEDEDDTETENEEDTKKSAETKKRGRVPTKKAAASKSSSSPKKRGRPTKSPSGKPVSYVVDVGTKIMYEEEQYIAVDSRVGGPGMCQIGVSKNGEKEIVEYDEDLGHMKKAEVSKLLRKGATIYES
jgi:hypothetical protein